MEIALAIISFLLSALILISVFLLISFFFIRKHGDSITNAQDQLDIYQFQDDPYLDHQKQKNKVKQSQFQKNRLNLSRINLSKLSQTDGMLSNRLLNSVPGTNYSKNQSFRKPYEIDIQQNENEENTILKHVYISKIANYTAQGVQIYDKQLKTIQKTKVLMNQKWIDEIKEVFIVSHEFYAEDEDNLVDILQIIKLQQYEYDAIRFVTQVQINNCEYDKEYNIELLTTTQRLEVITQNQYEQQCNKLNEV